VLDLGCGIGGATLPIAEITVPTGLAAGVDLSSAMIEHATRRKSPGNRISYRRRLFRFVSIRSSTLHAANDSSSICRIALLQLRK
jgi:ubiquinone/menaquinone biosynthesis C-methylase UbiE